MPEMSELDKLRLEKEQLELEELRWQVSKRKAEREQKQISHAQVESDLKTYRDNVAANQAYCNHRKGGRNIEGLQGRGTDGQYAVIHHRFADGRIGVMCLRCQKMWLPSDPGYMDAVNFPTDNTMSEGAQFRFEKVTA